MGVIGQWLETGELAAGLPACQAAPLCRFPQPASRCARSGRPEIFPGPQAGSGAGFAGAGFLVPAGKHLGRPGRPVVRAPSFAARGRLTPGGIAAARASPFASWKDGLL